MRANTKKKHVMGRRFAIVIGVAAVGVMALGAQTGAQTPSCLPTSERTPGPHAFAGLTKARAAPVYTDALQFAQFVVVGLPLDNPWVAYEADTLTSEGFVSGIWQSYFSKHHPADAGALAQTVQLGSPEQAQAESNRHDFRKRGQDPWKRFTVAAIPGSHGQRNLRHGHWQLDFTDGDYSYAIALGVGRRLALRGTRQVTKAAINLYNRVHGAAVCP